MMVLRYHVIVSAYGFWLPNDPRGSWSDFVGSWELFRFGKATKTDTRRSVASVPHNRQLRESAKRALKFPPVRFSGRQALEIARGFQQACAEAVYVVYGCAILPEHVHLVVARHERPIEQIVGHFKSRATRRLKVTGLWRNDRQPIWGKRCWKVFLNDEKDMRRAIRYVESNPLKEGKSSQQWSFVTPYACLAAGR